jgi:hypothetical protein
MTKEASTKIADTLTCNWIKNPNPEHRIVPDDAHEWHRNGWNIDYIDENGKVIEGVPVILSFMGPDIVTYYRKTTNNK